MSRRLLAALPRGGSLPEQSWQTRHQWVMVLIAAHVVLIPLYAVHQGNSLLHGLVEVAPITVLLALVVPPRLGRTLRASGAALALMLCSGVIVHLSGGLVEAHFHFFVVIPVVALYEAWSPFALGVAYVLVHHGWMGMTDPRQVYNHPAAWEHPLVFAVVHATFFAAACAACIVNWMLHERARLAAQSQSEMLSTIVGALQDGLVVTDGRGRVRVDNPASERLMPGFGWEAAPALDRLRHLDGSPVTYDDLPHRRATDGREGSDLLWRTPGEPDRVLSFATTRLGPGQELGPLGVVTIVRDVTERHLAHEATAAALAAEQQVVAGLVELERVKSEFVSTVSHELRTPVTSIVGYLELLEDGAMGELTGPQQEIVGRLGRNGRRLSALVEDLLTHSRIESAQLSVTLAPVDLRDVVTQACDAAEGLLAGRDLELVVEVPDLPVVQPADASELERLLVNLLSNAVKFTPDGGRVTVGLAADPDGATLSVADTGLGIPEAEQPQLFTRFFRSSTAVRNAVQGTGLGLAIVQAIAGLHGGAVTARSEVGRGSVFTVRLPRLGATPAEVPGPRRQEQSVVPAPLAG